MMALKQLPRGNVNVVIVRSSCQEMLLRKGVLKICSKFPGEHPCRSVLPIKLQSKNSSKIEDHCKKKN